VIAQANGTISITGIGAYAPERVVTNDDLSELMDTSDEWIVERTGIRERRVAADDQALSDLAPLGRGDSRRRARCRRSWRL